MSLTRIGQILDETPTFTRWMNVYRRNCHPFPTPVEWEGAQTDCTNTNDCPNPKGRCWDIPLTYDVPFNTNSFVRDEFLLQFGLHYFEPDYRRGFHDFYLTLKNPVVNVELFKTLNDVCNMMLVTLYNHLFVSGMISDWIRIYICQGGSVGSGTRLLPNMDGKVLFKGLTACKNFKLKKQFHIHLKMDRRQTDLIQEYDPHFHEYGPSYVEVMR